MNHPYPMMFYLGRQRLVHRVRAEKALGKPLPPKAIVHHADGSFSEDAPLVICQDQRYHKLLHTRERVLRAGGNPNTQRICFRCKALKTFDELQGDPMKQVRECKDCSRTEWRERNRRKRAEMTYA